MDHRCNRLFECIDKSDENDCTNLLVDKESYAKDMPPFTDGTKVKVIASLILMSVDKIDLTSATFNAKIKLILKWVDYRLTFTNLLKDGNIVGKDMKQEIWVPPLRFTNAPIESLINDQETTISIIKEGKYELNDITELHEARMYKGSENELKYSRNYEMDFKCSYNLVLYPFDTQTCTINFDIPNVFREYIDIYNESMRNIGSSKLEQFWITNVELISTKNNAEIIGKISFKRIPWFHISTTYAPIVCLFIMVLATLFIDTSHFEATIMIALTGMLVMQTLFTSISSSMPETAYLKLLDYWLIFGLIMPFLVFVVLVIWELMATKLPDVHANAGMYGPQKEKFIVPMKCCKYFLPILTIVFVIIYMLFVLVIYNREEMDILEVELTKIKSFILDV